MAYKAVGEWGTWECLGAQLAQELHDAKLLIRQEVSLRDAMCEALAKSVENPVPVQRWKVPAGMEVGKMTEAQIKEVMESGAVAWVQRPCETGFLIYQWQGDPRYAYKTDILFGGFRELDLAPVIEKLDSYKLVLVGSFHTHGATRTQRYAHAFPSVTDFEFAASYDLKMVIIGEQLDERRSEVLFLFLKYAKTWEAVLESKIMQRIAYPCPYRAQSSIFEVADEDTPPKEFCATCLGLWKEDSIDALFSPYFIMLKVELPDFHLLWANGSLDGVVEVS